jgi:hypothetical protein
MEPVKSSGKIIASKLSKKAAEAEKTKGERMAEELINFSTGNSSPGAEKIRKELPEYVHRSYAALQLADKEKAAKILELLRRIK